MKVSFDVLNPASGEVVATLPDTTVDDIEIIIAQSHVTQPEWSARAAEERGEILDRWHLLVMDNS